MDLPASKVMLDHRSGFKRSRGLEPLTKRREPEALQAKANNAKMEVNLKKEEACIQA